MVCPWLHNSQRQCRLPPKLLDFDAASNLVWSSVFECKLTYQAEEDWGNMGAAVDKYFCVPK